MLREWKEKGSGHMVRGLGVPLEHLEKKGEGEYVCDGDSSRKGDTAYFNCILWATGSYGKCLKRTEHVLGRVKSTEKKL